MRISLLSVNQEKAEMTNRNGTEAVPAMKLLSHYRYGCFVVAPLAKTHVKLCQVFVRIPQAVVDPDVC
jgi:hypothetical protein